MGLLTDPNTKVNKLRSFVVNYQVKICCALVILSIGWIISLSNDKFSASTYFSENALLPGLVHVEFPPDERTTSVMQELQKETARNPFEIPHVWLLQQFQNLNLEAYVHNFTVISPLKGVTKFYGRNVYGILRAPRSASFEALVLSVPYRVLPDGAPVMIPGLALMFELASHFKKQKYWAKDIIFLVTEHDHLGIQAWLDAYHGTSSGAKGVVETGILEEHCGAIQAAINLEIQSSVINHFDVKIAGLNGQLPNLDLVNLVHRICSKEGVQSTFYNKNSKAGTRTSTWNHKIRTMMSMMLSQASGVPDGNHGLFHRFGIEAITLVGEPKYGRGGISFHIMGRVLEGMFRSLNNLLERFHQSFFFYLLPSTDRYVSIGMYIPAVAFLVGALYLRSYAVWLKSHYNVEDEKLEEFSGKVKKKINFMVISVVMLTTHATGMFVMPFGNYMVKFLPYSTEFSMFLAYAIVYLFTTIVFALAVKRCSRNAEWCLLHAICLNELATFLICVSMHNFSFGYIIALIYVLPTLCISSSQNGWFKKMMWMLFHPLAVMYWITLAMTVYEYDDLPWPQLAVKSFETVQRVIVLNVSDALIYGNWTFAIVNAVLLPNWTALWCLINMPHEQLKLKTD